MIDLESIKRRLKAITPGRREVEKDTGTGGFFVSALVGPGWETVARFGVRRGGDAVFDAKAPADMTVLIAEVERLEKARQAAERTIAALQAQIKELRDD